MEQVSWLCHAQLIHELEQMAGVGDGVAFLHDQDSFSKKLLRPLDKDELVRDSLHLLSEVPHGVDFGRTLRVRGEEVLLSAELKEDVASVCVDIEVNFSG